MTTSELSGRGGATSGGRLVASPETDDDAASDPLAHAILATLVYGDVFDFPATLSEIHRRLIRYPETTLDAVRECVGTSPLLAGRLAKVDDLYCLAGRESLSNVRRKRRAASESLWAQARRYAAVLASVPFIRGVMVTGALAAKNEDSDGDIDYLVVVEEGSVWRAHALIWCLVKLDHWFGGRRLCVNYYLGEDAPPFEERSLYIAYELSLMTPLYGRRAYENLRETNRWSAAFLRNAVDLPDGARELSPRAPRIKRLLEIALGNPIGQWIERRIHRFKLRRVGSRAKSVTAVSPSDAPADRVGWARSERKRRVAEYRDEGLGFRGRHTTQELTLCDLDFGEAILDEYEHRLATALQGEPTLDPRRRREPT